MNRSFVVPLFVLVGLIAGCQAQGPAKENVKVVKSMVTVHKDLGMAAAQVQRTNEMLSEFSRSTDLKSTYTLYGNALKDLKASAEEAQKRGQQMRDNRDAYLAQWEQEIQAINNPNLKGSSEERREMVRSSFANITTLADTVRTGYAPYLDSLEQINRALSIDLTPAGVQAIQPAITKAKADGEKLFRSLDALGIELDKLTGSIRPG